jgi:YVTN family beta-propeller protein
MKKLLLSIIWAMPGVILAAPEAFVVNNLAETLSKINLETGAVQNHITVLGETPNQIAFYEGYLYVINSVSANLLKINPNNYQVVEDVPMPVGSNPYFVEFDGAYVFVTGWVSGYVYRIDLTSNQVDDEVAIGAFPEGMVVSRGRLYVTQTAFNPNDYSYGQGRMSRINPADMSVEAVINVGKNPQSFVEISDSIIHVICTGNYDNVTGAIYIYNTRSQLMVDSVLIGGQPVGGALSRDGIVFLAAGGWVNNGYVFAYNAVTSQIVNGPTNPIITGMGVTGVAVDSLGYAYSCNLGDDNVSKISLQGPPFPPYAVGDGPQSIVILDDRIIGIDDDNSNLPRRPMILGNYPNPFNSRTIIRYDLAGNSPAEIRIFDIQGKLIRNLPLESGLGSVGWDGANSGGQICPSGVYFARLIADSFRDGENPGNSVRLIFVK